MKSVLVGLAIMFCLLISSIANAQCAWVLWTKTETLVKDKGLDVRWELIGAVPNYDHCVEMLKLSYQTYKRTWLGDQIDNKEKANDEKFLLFPFLGRSIRFYCLPDTIDPRK